AGLAAIIDREVDIGGVEHRNILDPQRDVGGRAETGGGVQRDVVASQMPGVFARCAAGVGAVLETDDGSFLALGVLGAATRATVMDDVFRVLYLGFTRVEENLGAVAHQQRVAVTQTDIALQLAAILELIEARLIGLGLHAALA